MDTVTNVRDSNCSDCIDCLLLRLKKIASNENNITGNIEKLSDDLIRLRDEFLFLDKEVICNGKK